LRGRFSAWEISHHDQQPRQHSAKPQPDNPWNITSQFHRSNRPMDKQHSDIRLMAKLLGQHSVSF
jgi:hypothetical protein